MTLDSAPAQHLAFTEFIKLMLKPIWWPSLLVPPALLALEYLFINYLDLLGNKHKLALEDAALVILWASVAIASIRALIRREWFFVWLIVLIGALLFREYHLMKIATGITYGIMVGLIIAAWLNYEVFRPYLTNALTMTLLFMTGLTYVLTQTLDIDFFKYGHRSNSIVEELMEVTGHLFALLLAILARPNRPGATEANAPSSEG